jgi:hypothetical protein
MSLSLSHSSQHDQEHEQRELEARNEYLAEFAVRLTWLQLRSLDCFDLGVAAGHGDK